MTRAASDAASVRAAWSDVQRELAVHEPIAWIYHSRGVQGLSARLRDVTMDLRGEMVTIARWSTGTASPRRSDTASLHGGAGSGGSSRPGAR